MDATKAKTKALPNGKYEGRFRWARRGAADVQCFLTKNGHGWFCDTVNGQDWVYPTPTHSEIGWGVQVAKSTPLEAVRGFLRQWDAAETTPDPFSGECDEDAGVPTAADRLTLTKIES